MSQKILIIEDDEQVSMLIESTLRAVGYVVKALSDPGKAIRLFRSESFDLVLSDVGLRNEIDGHDIACWIAAQGWRCRVALMSGSARDCERCPIVGNCPLLPKPFTRGQLIGFVADALASTPTIDFSRVRNL